MCCKPVLTKKNLLSLSLSLLAYTSIDANAQRAPNLARSLSTSMGAEGRVMWIDATANFWRKRKVNGRDELIPFTTTREGIAEIVQKCKSAHVNTLVVDVKPLVGYVVFPSKVAPRLTSWQGRPIPDIDILQGFIEEGHKAGLRVHASLNILGEGHKYYSIGLAYEKPEWQSVVYAINRGMTASNGKRLTFRVPKEPDNPDKPLLLTDDGAKSNTEIERIGLDRPDAEDTKLTGLPFGKQLHITIDSANRVEGIIDGSLIGEEPLAAPEDGRMLVAKMEADKEWITNNVAPGSFVTFDLKTEFLPIAEARSEKIACFVNPLHPEARKHQIDLVREIVTNYEVDGIVLDRCRYSNIYNDFSDLSRQAFSRWLGKPVNRWPQDIFSFSPQPGKKIIQGPLFKMWLEFRATVIHDFVGELARNVRSLKPNITLGTYVGAWYPSYYEVGVNWGSEKTHLRYSWFTEEYPKTGYAEFFDWIALGSYHPVPNKEEARRQGKSANASVEGLTELGNTAIANAAFTYGGIFVPDYRYNPEAMVKALEAASRQGQGWMIFDLSYIEEFNFWQWIEKATKAPAPAPDSLRSLLPVIRSAMDVVR